MTAPADNEQMALGVVKSNLAMKPDTLLWSRPEDGPISLARRLREEHRGALQGATVDGAARQRRGLPA